MRVWLGSPIPGLEKLIIDRIDKSKKRYSKREQRGELLIRNRQFREEFMKFSDYVHEAKKQTDSIKFLEASEFISGFCDRWNISRECPRSSRFILKLSSIPQFMKDPVLLGFDPFSFIKPPESIDFSRIERLPEDEYSASPGFIYLKIDAWTSLQDIKNIFGEVNKIQRAMFGYKAEEKPNFGRDLCWYDLYHEFHFSYKKIAYLWAMFLPDDVISLVKKLRSEKKYNEDLTDTDLDKQVDAYIKGDEFRQVIKSAIKRIEKAIEALNLSKSFFIKEPSFINIPQPAEDSSRQPNKTSHQKPPRK